MRPRSDGGAPATASRAPAFRFAVDGRFGRVLSPPLVRFGAMLPTSTLRLDLHPADLRHARHMMALEWVLQRSRSREAVTYHELSRAPKRFAAAGAFSSAGLNDLTAGRAA